MSYQMPGHSEIKQKPCIFCIQGFDTCWYRLLSGWQDAHQLCLYLKISMLQVLFQAVHLFCSRDCFGYLKVRFLL